MLEFLREHASVVYVKPHFISVCNTVAVTLDKPFILEGSEHWTGFITSCCDEVHMSGVCWSKAAHVIVNLLETKGESSLLEKIPHGFFHSLNVMCCTALLFFLVYTLALDPELDGEGRDPTAFELSLHTLHVKFCKIMAWTMRGLQAF